uniref:Uncharacterized protein n=1 Tax=Tanacetum cinerariifolium TaxID=118510 RepID=A0A6L2N9S4_TANCI|nr:hypothetical protein [Tanacetum cinerariifolium]
MMMGLLEVAHNSIAMTPGCKCNSYVLVLIAPHKSMHMALHIIRASYKSWMPFHRSLSRNTSTVSSGEKNQNKRGLAAAGFGFVFDANDSLITRTDVGPFGQRR